MRRPIVAAGLLVVAAGLLRAAPAQESVAAGGRGKARPVIVPAERVARVERWLKAVDRHEPGEPDEAVAEVSGWTIDELRGLWVDVVALSQLTRNVRMSHFTVRSENGSAAVEISYSSQQLRRMVALACAAAGMLASNSDCAAVKAGTQVDEELFRLATHAAAERARSGDDNYMLRRAALLHSDIAMLQPHAMVEPFATRATPLVGPQSWRIDIADGRGTGGGMTAVHWDIARTAFDQIRPPGAAKPAPERDSMVRTWYRATGAWMQFREDHDTLHLDHGRKIFPDDPDLLFLSGCQRETYAAPAIQAAAHTVSLPSGFAVAIGSERAELRQAENLLRRAVTAAPEMGEAHLRLGRVLGLLGRHQEAVAELQQALTQLTDDDSRYYDALFSGAEEEALGRFDAARDAYQRAATLFPLAQSPLVALSQLAHRRGDRAAAAAAMRMVFELPAAVDRGTDDPWWHYHVHHARNAEDLVDSFRGLFR
jgi:tetratricopeptide (TPR) repeat protein